MKFLRQSATVVLLAGALCLPGIAAPQKSNQNRARNEHDRERMPAGRVQNNAPRPGKWLSEHLNLSPEQRQKELSNDPEFKQLNPQQQQHLQQRLNQFNNLPPEQQKRTVKRMQIFEALPQERQDLLRTYPVSRPVLEHVADDQADHGHGHVRRGRDEAGRSQRTAP